VNGVHFQPDVRAQRKLINIALRLAENHRSTFAAAVHLKHRADCGRAVVVAAADRKVLHSHTPYRLKTGPASSLGRSPSLRSRTLVCSHTVPRSPSLSLKVATKNRKALHSYTPYWSKTGPASSLGYSPSLCSRTLACSHTALVCLSR